jgi:hypothetical protein
MSLFSLFLNVGIIGLIGLTPFGGIEPETLRLNYEKAVSDKKLCKSMTDQLINAESSLHLAYLGAFQTIWANHTSNPVSKLDTFTKGKKNIEKAVASSPEDLEIRFLRLSVQMNCPSFLGYNNKIEEDRLFIKSNIHNIRSATLKKMCKSLIQ